jgi:hypothetical protein
MGTFFASCLTFVVILLFAPVAHNEQRGKTALTWGQCTKPPVEACFTHRGRLSGQNGIAHMIWLVGTKRIVAVDNTEMPDTLLKYLDMASPDHSDIYGDYKICPLESDRPGYMQSVCVSSASRLVVQDRDRSRPPVRLLSTWP